MSSHLGRTTIDHVVSVGAKRQAYGGTIAQGERALIEDGLRDGPRAAASLDREDVRGQAAYRPGEVARLKMHARGRVGQTEEIDGLEARAVGDRPDLEGDDRVARRRVVSQPSSGGRLNDLGLTARTGASRRPEPPERRAPSSRSPRGPVVPSANAAFAR